MAEIDMDQDLLRQFSCMGTQDKDVLVTDLYDLLGNQLSREGCAFFLDMTNWNLQAAVGAYYDYYGQVSLPEMSLVEDVTIGNGECIPPGTPFTKTWRIRNSGTSKWPAGVFLGQKSGHSFSGPPVVDVPCLSPGQEANISVNLESPLPSGLYQSQWRLCNSDGSVCGDALWVIIKVEEPEVATLTQQFSSITTQESGMELESSRSEGYSNPFASPTSISSGFNPLIPVSSDPSPINAHQLISSGMLDASHSPLCHPGNALSPPCHTSDGTRMENCTMSSSHVTSGPGIGSYSVSDSGNIEYSSFIDSASELESISQSLIPAGTGTIAQDSNMAMMSSSKLEDLSNQQQQHIVPHGSHGNTDLS